MSTKVSSKQCRAARDLLKWNLHDLVSRVNVPVKRLESFERGSIQLYQNENHEIAEVFKKNGIEFLSDFEVKLKKEVKDKQKTQVFAGTVGMGQNATANMGSDDSSPISNNYGLNPERVAQLSSLQDEGEPSISKPSIKKP
jgi:hypothetical protein